MALNPLFLKALGHGLKAIGYAAFTDEGPQPRSRTHSIKRKKPAAKRSGSGSCCTARREAVPPLREDGGDD
jgi:hypothetical protein